MRRLWMGVVAVVLTAGCTNDHAPASAGAVATNSTAGACPSINPVDHEAPSPFVDITHHPSFALLRYQSLAVYVPGFRSRALSSNPFVLKQSGEPRLQTENRYATDFSSVDQGTATITMTGPAGRVFRMEVSVAC